jgi:hypothetical protein
MHLPDAKVLARSAQNLPLKWHDAIVAEALLAIDARLLFDKVLMIEAISGVSLADDGASAGSCWR